MSFEVAELYPVAESIEGLLARVTYFCGGSVAMCTFDQIKATRLILAYGLQSVLNVT